MHPETRIAHDRLGDSAPRFASKPFRGTPTLDAFFSALLQEWNAPLFITAGCVLSLALYFRGYFLLRESRPEFSPMRALSFLLGIATLWLALGSPLEVLADKVLTAHMMEHLLLTCVVPPLLWLGWPTVPMLRGVPAWVRRLLIDPLIRSQTVRSGVHGLDSPVLAWLSMNLALIAWHIPAAYNLALENQNWHNVEHACFLLTSLIFWWVLIRPWPARPGGSGWVPVVYLLTAELVNTSLAAFLILAGRPVYGFYLSHPNVLGLDPLLDQQIGAALMLLVASIAFILPAIAISTTLLQNSETITLLGGPDGLGDWRSNGLLTLRMGLPLVRKSLAARTVRTLRKATMRNKVFIPRRTQRSASID